MNNTTRKIPASDLALYGVMLVCFGVLCYMGYRYMDVEFLSFTSGDEMPQFLQLQKMYQGLISLNIKQFFSFEFYNYGFFYYVLNLLVASPFIATENYPLQIYAPRVLNALFSIANLFMIYRIARFYLAPRSSLLLVLAFIAMSGFWHQGYSYKPDVFQAFFVLVCAYYLLRDGLAYTRYYTLAWVWLGLGMGLAKFQAILFIPMILAYIAMGMRNLGLWWAIKRGFIATSGIFFLWILTNPYLLHPRGFKAWFSMFEGNMQSNATNHGSYTQVPLHDKLAMIDFYYFEIIIFAVLILTIIYLCAIALRHLLQPKPHTQNIQPHNPLPPNHTQDSHAPAILLAPIAAGLAISLLYLLFCVNKAWEAYYFSSIALGVITLGYLGTLRLAKMRIGGGQWIIAVIVLAQILGGSMNGSYHQVFTKYYVTQQSIAQARSLSDELTQALRPFITDSRATILSEQHSFSYLSLGIKPRNIHLLYGLGSPAGFVYEEWRKETRANAFIPKDFIILHKRISDPTPRNEQERESKANYHNLINGTYPYKIIATTEHFIILANTDFAHSNLTPSNKEQ